MDFTQFASTFTRGRLEERMTATSISLDFACCSQRDSIANAQPNAYDDDIGFRGRNGTLDR